MAERTFEERLDEAVAAILAGRAAPAAGQDADLARLLEIATMLQGLPRESFRGRLRSQLIGAAAPGKGEGMTSTSATTTAATATGIREGFNSVTPYLQSRRAPEVLEFVKRAFSAAETFRTAGAGGGMHAEVRIGDSMVMVAGSEGMPYPDLPAALHLYVEDADAAYRRALEAGGVSIYEPMDQPYGDREAGVKDPAGNVWYVATHRGSGPGRHVPEGLRSVTPYFHPRGAAGMIDFLELAFDAQELMREESPEGLVRHARVRIGDSAVEMGDAHGPWQPMPAAIYLYVRDVDSFNERAVRAGGTSVSAPADQPYGDRFAHVTDPFGNTWYLATNKANLRM